MNSAATIDVSGDRQPMLRWLAVADCTIGWKENIFLPGHASRVPTVRRRIRTLRQRALVSGLYRPYYNQTAGPREPGREDCRTALPVLPDRQAAG